MVICDTTWMSDAFNSGSIQNAVRPLMPIHEGMAQRFFFVFFGGVDVVFTRHEAGLELVAVHVGMM